MAQDKVAIDILINAAGSAKSVKDLKQSMKDLKNAALEVGEGSKDFVKLTNAAAQAQDEMNDLNDSIRALDKGNLGQNIGKIGSTIAGGFQAAQGAMALFGSESQDVEKALLKVQAATALSQGIQSVADLGKAFKSFGLILRANPIFLIATILVGVGAAVIALKDKFKFLSDTVDFFSGILESTIGFFKDLSDSIFGTTFALDELNEKTIKANESIIKSTEATQAAVERRYDKEIAVANAAGKDVYKLEKAKTDFQIESQRKIIASFEAIRKASGTLTEDQLAELQKASIALGNLKNEQLVKDTARQKEANDKALENRKKVADRQKDFAKKERGYEIEKQEFEKSEQERKDKEEEEALIKRLNTNVQLNEKANSDIANSNAKALQDEEDAKKAKILIAKNTADSLTSLGEIFISDSKKLEKFQKASALVQIAIDTAKAISYLTRDSSGNPYNVLTGGLAGVAQFSTGIAMILGNMAKAKQLLTSGGSGSAPSLGGGARSASTGGTSGGVSINPLRSTTSTTIESEKVEQGQSVVRAYVVESDITSKQNSINNIVKKSKI